MMGTQELIIIFAVMLLLFGSSKLPKLGGAIGESIKNFKKGLGGESESNQNSNLPKQSQEASKTPTHSEQI